jgi:Flp pilus assembly protein TadG
MERRRSYARGYWQDCRGTAAIEMALLAPILIFALLAAYDLGNAIQKRMKLAHVVRVGVEAALDQGPSAPDQDALAEILWHMSTAAGGDQFVLEVERLCGCPETAGTYTSCTCIDGQASFVYFRLEGSHLYSGNFLPSMPLITSRLVQVR